MRYLLPDKVKYYKDFAEDVYRQFRKIRYGIGPGVGDEFLSGVRKSIVDWQACDDDAALTAVSIRYNTWLPITYEGTSSASLGLSSSSPSSGINVGYNYPGGTQNLIEVNAGGCITRINLNPTVNISNTSTGSTAQFVYEQLTPSTTWTINHGLGFRPNAYTIDSSGVNIIGNVDSATLSTLVLSFSKPVSGFAYLS